MPKGTTKLTSMKLDPKKLEERMQPKSVIADDSPVYPYGLRVHLDEDSLDALGMKTLPKVGGSMYLGANVKVVSVSDNEHTSEGGETHRHRSVELQITDMGLDKAESDSNAEQALYTE
jgi:hypothetical protein